LPQQSKLMKSALPQYQRVATAFLSECKLQLRQTVLSGASPLTLASRVLPQPGGPYSSTPAGMLAETAGIAGRTHTAQQRNNRKNQ
jgi:hypothetical protein